MESNWPHCPKCGDGTTSCIKKPMKYTVVKNDGGVFGVWFCACGYQEKEPIYGAEKE